MTERKRRNYIRVVDIPPGGAPDEIREEWVEMYLPLARDFAELFEQYFEIDGEIADDSDILRQAGVLPDDIETGQITTKNAGGYAINAEDAIQSLLAIGTDNSLKAAEYWKSQLTALYGGYQHIHLLFDRDVCEFIGKIEEQSS